MTNNASNQPFEPFQVQSNLLKSATQSDPERQGTGEAGKSKSAWYNKPLGSSDASAVGWLALPLFAAVYAITEQQPDLRPVTIFVLLACLLLRMDARDRHLAGVPLTLAGFRLVYQMALGSRPILGSPEILAPQTKDSLLGMPWLPLFLAICIFYLPRKATVTGKNHVGGRDLHAYLRLAAGRRLCGDLRDDPVHAVRRSSGRLDRRSHLQLQRRADRSSGALKPRSIYWRGLLGSWGAAATIERKCKNRDSRKSGNCGAGGSVPCSAEANFYAMLACG